MTWQMTLLRIGLAIVVGTIIGIEREYKNRPAGMRTHILVCLGACTIALMESSFLREVIAMDAYMSDRVTYNFGRLSAQVICGIGFLGAGTIFTAQKKIAGLTTAASLWNTACLGLAIGYGYYMIALLGTVFVMLTLMAMQRIVHVNTIKKVEIKFVHRVETIGSINAYFDTLNVKTLDLDFHVDTSADANVYTNTYTLHLPSGVSYTDIVNHLSEHSNVLSIRTTNT